MFSSYHFCTVKTYRRSIHVCFFLFD